MHENPPRGNSIQIYSSAWKPPTTAHSVEHYLFPRPAILSGLCYDPSSPHLLLLSYPATISHQPVYTALWIIPAHHLYFSTVIIIFPPLSSFLLPQGSLHPFSPGCNSVFHPLPRIWKAPHLFLVQYLPLLFQPSLLVSPAPDWAFFIFWASCSP